MSMHLPEQIDFIVVQLGSVVSEPSCAALTTNLPRLPYTTRIHTCTQTEETETIGW